jgi:hypothetical protein
MDHDYYKDKISAFFDGELKNEEAVMFAEHLKKCQICQQELEKLQQFDKLVQENSQLSDSEYWEKSAQRIESILESDKKIEAKVTEIKPFVWKGLEWKLTTVAASIALITFIAIYEKDMSDEIYEQTEPKSLIVEQPIPETTDVTHEYKSDETSQKEPTEGSSELDQKPQETEQIPEKSNVQAPPIPLADKFVGDSKDVNIALERNKEEKKDIITVKAESPLVVRDKTTTIDIIKSEEVQTLIEANKENEIQLSSATDNDIDAEEFGADSSGDEILTLNQWREKRDHLQSSTNGVKMPDLKQGFDKTKISSSASIISNEGDKVITLLECYYNIALLTNASDEYDQAIEGIEKYLNSEKDKYKKQAELYIEKLSKVKDKK